MCIRDRPICVPLYTAFSTTAVSFITAPPFLSVFAENKALCACSVILQNHSSLLCSVIDPRRFYALCANAHSPAVIFGHAGFWGCLPPYGSGRTPAGSPRLPCAPAPPYGPARRGRRRVAASAWTQTHSCKRMAADAWPKARGCKRMAADAWPKARGRRRVPAGAGPELFSRHTAPGAAKYNTCLLYTSRRAGPPLR